MAVTTANPKTEVENGSMWWLMLLNGIFLTIIGWWLLSQPVTTTIVLVQFLGLYWVIAGIIDIVEAIFDKQAESRGWKAFGGVFGIIAGMIVLNNMLFAAILTPTILLYFVAFAFIINGIIRIFLGKMTDTNVRKRSWGSFFVGLFYTIFGFVLLGMPRFAGIATVVYTAGLLGIFGGVMMMVTSFQIKGASKK